MEKSLAVTGNMPSAVVVENATTAAHSASSRKAASRPISSGHKRSKGDSINILMVALNDAQDVFGKFESVRAPGDEPLLLVFPKTLDICQACGLIIERNGQPYCEQHQPEHAPN